MMTDPETLAGLLRQANKAPEAIWGWFYHTESEALAKWLIERGVRVSPERAAPPGDDVIDDALFQLGQRGGVEGYIDFVVGRKWWREVVMRAAPAGEGT